MKRMLTNTLTNDEIAVAGNAPKGTTQSPYCLSLPTYNHTKEKNYDNYNKMVS